VLLAEEGDLSGRGKEVQHLADDIKQIRKTVPGGFGRFSRGGRGQAHYFS